MADDAFSIGDRVMYLGRTATILDKDQDMRLIRFEDDNWIVWVSTRRLVYA